MCGRLPFSTEYNLVVPGPQGAGAAPSLQCIINCEMSIGTRHATEWQWLGQWMHGLQGQSLGPAPAPPMSRGRQNFLARYSLCPSCHCTGQISEISDLTAFVLIAFLLIAPFRAPEYKLKLLQRNKFAVVINKYLII